MAEIITEEQPRIKFSTHARGTFTLQAPSDELQSLIVLMEKMEELGAAPVLNDGKVGGNCGISWSLADKVAGSEPDMLVSKSGKEAGAMLQPQDFVRLRCFDRVAWAAEYSAVSADVRPSSDSPLLNACLCSDKARNYGWQHVPRVAIHGHALAEGEGGSPDVAHTLHGDCAVSRGPTRDAAQPQPCAKSGAAPAALLNGSHNCFLAWHAIDFSCWADMCIGMSTLGTRSQPRFSLF